MSLQVLPMKLTLDCASPPFSLLLVIADSSVPRFVGSCGPQSDISSCYGCTAYCIQASRPERSLP